MLSYKFLICYLYNTGYPQLTSNFGPPTSNFRPLTSNKNHQNPSSVNSNGAFINSLPFFTEVHHIFKLKAY